MTAMKRAALSVCFLVSACVASDPVRNPPAAVDLPTREAIEAQAREAASTSKPRKEHRALEALVGHWDTKVVTVAADGMESEARPGRATIESVLGRRYLNWSAWLELGGETHATTGYLGFDVNQSEYQLLMISDLATGMGVARGRGDLRGGGVRFTIEIHDPESGALRRAASTLRVVDAQRFVLEQMGIDSSGKERVVRRTHYVRAKSP